MKRCLLITLLVGLLAGCEGNHRNTFTEGNVLEGMPINGITVGLSKSQVAKLMGTPVYENLFRQNRWIYINHVMKQGENRTQQVYLDFENGKLARISKDD